MNTQVRAFIVISTVTLFGLATPAMAVVNWYNSSATDNSGGATVDDTIDQSSGWVDTFIRQGSGTSQSGGVEMQANGPSQFGGGPNYMVLAFGDLGIANADDVTTATLHVDSVSVGLTQTYNIYGLTGTVDNNTTWANAGLDPATANTYGTFSSGTSGAFSFSLTDAIKAYIRGDITGIAFGTTESSGFASNSDNAIKFATSDNTNTALRPSLMVDFVPEPSTYALIFGLVALVGVVRRRNNRSSSMPIPA